MLALGAMVVDFDAAFAVVVVGVTTVAAIDVDAIEYLDFLIAAAAVNCCSAN